MPGDEVDLHPEGVHDAADALVAPDLGELGCWVEGIAPHVYRRQGERLSHAIDGTRDGHRSDSRRGATLRTAHVLESKPTA